MWPQLLRRSSSRAGAAAASTAVLLLVVTACCLPLVHADAVVGKWNSIITDAMVEKKIGANMGRAPLPTLANLVGGNRIMSIMHVAQWKGINAVLAASNITSMSEAKERIPALQPDLQAAVASAGQTVLLAALPEMGEQAQALYSSQAGDADGRQAGAVAMGKAAAQEVLKLRATDGANATVPEYKGSNDTGMWRPTPPKFMPGAGVQFQKVTPWVMDSPDQFRPATPPALKSPEYEKSYLEIMSVGNATSAARTKAQTEEVYLWNELPDVLLFGAVDQVTKDSDILDASRIYAMAAVSGLDSRVASFDAKYHYSTWRPLTAIPLGNGIGLPADPNFASVIPTPPTPEFPSGHAMHGEAILEVLRLATGDGQTKVAEELTLTSPVPLPVVKRQRRLQGQGQQGPDTAPVTRSYTSLKEMSDQLAISRVNAGLHYRFTVEPSIQTGKAVAGKVWSDFDKKYTTIRV